MISVDFAPAILDESGNEQIIATTDSHPFWVVTDVTRKGVSHPKRCQESFFRVQ